MKKLAFVCLVTMLACSEEQEYAAYESEWKVSWEVEDEEMQGSLVLFNNKYAQLMVHGDPSSLLVKEAYGINYQWQKSGKQLILKRLDNNIELKYDILKEDSNYIELSYANDINVKFFRQETTH